jgi:hypothetical protein
MEAEDWLKGVEKKLMIALCMDREKVFFCRALALWYDSKLVGDIL